MIGSELDTVVLIKLVVELPLELTELEDCEADVPLTDLFPPVRPFKFLICNGIKRLFNVG